MSFSALIVSVQYKYMFSVYVCVYLFFFFQNDPLLYDLPTEVTLEEINSCIALEYGQAMVVNVRKANDEVMGRSC